MKALLAAAALVIVCLAGCSTHPNADFVITEKPIGQPFAGFGVCMNPYLYCYPNTPDEISPTALADLEAKVKALHPQFVRIFFLNDWWEKDFDPEIAKNHPGTRDSFLRTVRLPQDAGARVLVQLWYDPKRYADPDGVARRFAQALYEMRTHRGLT